MKKRILSGIFALALLATAGHGVNKSMKSETEFSDLVLSNVEALAYLEDGCDGCHSGNYGREPRTLRCKLDLGGGMFTSSVERVCDITADASRTCVPVECGGYF